jgi:raffinose/stachyose/melibiose transport system permease protein
MALILSRKPRGWKFFRTVYFLPQVISGIALAMLWSAVYNSEYGLLNGLLRSIGLGSLAKNWLGTLETAFPCMLIYWVFYVGYYMVIMMADITNVDESYYEAAKIDGAGTLAQHRYVTIPLIKGSISTCVTLAMIFGLRTFEQVYLLTNGGPANRTSVLVLYLYNQMKTNNYGGANASSVMLILTGACVILMIRGVFSRFNKE